jgi:UDP-GlcNAc:undecaprenyl-phosphate GlcNAc-1-phosphate transferase
MGITNTEYFLLFVISYLLVGVLTPVMRKIAIATDVVDRPNSFHKSHKKPVPYLGGVAIIMGVITVSYSASLFSQFTSSTFWLATSVLGPALLLGLIGLWDDIKNLSPLPRFIAQTFAGIFTASILIITDSIGNPTGSSIFDSIITVVWIVGICNSINFFDNLDGGAAGTVAISSIALAYLALNGDQYLIAALSVVTAGSTLGFLVWNKSPAKIYMGDAGALFLGIIIAVLTIRLDPEVGPQSRALAIPLLLMAVPILDTTTVVISRLSRGISPFTGGRDHLSHRLMRKGLGRKATAYVLWAMAAAFGAVAFIACCVESSLTVPAIFAAGAIWLISLVTFLRIPATDK